jgi:hypothetical protein
MKVEFCRDGSILIVPETDFESDYIQSFGIEALKCFVKHGSTAPEVGIKIVKNNGEKPKE